MYIPTIFFNQAGGCIQPFISGSASQVTSPNYNMGKLISGSQTYFYIDIAANVTASFQIASGVTTTAKLLLIGGGGYSFPYQINPLNTNDSNSGGGAAGMVYFNDISLEPGTYQMTAGRGGYSSSLDTESGVESTFLRFSSSFNPIVAPGGSAFNGVGGTNGTYTGGNPITGNQGAGGGGAGSAGNGTSATKITNYSIGGNGGAATGIPAPFNSVFQDISSQTAVAGGGGGGSYSGNDGSDEAPLSYGSGGSGQRGGNNPGFDGRAIIYIPVGNCEVPPTGSLILPTTESFQAVGGDTIGTFVSSSVTYKYHLFYFYSGSTTFFRTTNGCTKEAKVILVGGGAGGRDNYETNGGAGAGKVSISRNLTLYGIYGVTPALGGAPNQNGNTSTIQSFSNFTDHYAANGGGLGANVIPGTRVAGQDGGSGGGGSRFFSGTWQTLSAGNAVNPSSGLEPYDTADEYYGNNGGAGSQVASGVGGGGGGATSVGSTNGNGGTGYTLTDEFFPSSVLFTTASIARGGDGGLVFTHDTQPYSGDGGRKGASGASGFVCITYPISGSKGNSPG